LSAFTIALADTTVLVISVSCGWIYSQERKIPHWECEDWIFGGGRMDDVRGRMDQNLQVFDDETWNGTLTVKP